VFQPLHSFAIEHFLNGNVRHRCGGRGPVPMLLAGWKPDHVTGPDFFDRAALPLNPTAAKRDDQGLAKGMCMPRRPRARLERDCRARSTRWFWCLK
jgi:hypothetical protein